MVDMMTKSKGFTLIELMITVIIIGIITSVAYPAFQEYTKRTKRSANIQKEMRDIAQRVVQRNGVYKRYDKIPFDEIFSTPVNANGRSSFPANDPTHRIFFTNASMNDSKDRLKSGNWVLRATPLSGSVFEDDGDLKLNSRGGTCWVEGTNNCTINSANAWRK